MAVLLRTYNILLLGQTGVGKSTFVNSISNYMTYNSLADALAANQPIIVIDAGFNLKFEHNERTVDLKVNMRGMNRRDVEDGLHVDGASATTMPSVYSFACQDIEFNIIDVPGIGDTRGIAQDNLNKQAIIKEISRFPEIHGICIMVREDTTRLTNELLFCLNEVLSCLHRNAQDNILFVIPRSGPSDFMPQSIQPILNAFIVQLNEMRGTTIDLTDRIFCIDNEPFRFQCGYNQSNAFRTVFGAQGKLEKYVDYWTRSKRNVFRFLSKMYDMKGHVTAETRAVAQANTSIQVILAVIPAVMACLADAQTSSVRQRQVEQLLRGGVFDKPDVGFSDDTSPQLVCVHPDCFSVERRAVGGPRAKFRQICHRNCRIAGVTIAKFPEPLLVHCQVFTIQRTCRECGHRLEEHMHMSREVLERETSAGGDGQRPTRDQAEQQVSKFVKQVKLEQEQILRSLVTMAVYCRDNAIVAYNSAFLERLEVEILTARARNKADSVATLRQISSQYRRLEQTFDKVENFEKTVAAVDVQEALRRLFSLSVYGGTIKSLYDSNMPSTAEVGERDVIRLNVSLFP